MNENTIYMLLPMMGMIMGDGMKGYRPFITLAFILFPLWKKFLMKGYHWIVPKPKGVRLTQSTTKKGYDQTNFGYEAVCFAVTNILKERKKDKHFSFVCFKTKSAFYTIDNDEFYPSSPIFIPDGKVKDVEFKEKNLICDFYINEEGKNVEIIGPTDICREFVEHCIKEFELHLYIENNSGIRKLFIFDKDEGWKGKEIRITKNFDNTYLPKHIETKLIHDIDSYLENKNHYEKMGIPYKRGYLFYGFPGTGKSSTVYAISHKTARNVYKISPKWFSESVFKDAISQIPPKSILLLEEIDTQVQKREKKKKKEKKDNDASSCDTKIDLSEMLNILDGYESLYDCIIIATTNYKAELDDALIRAGRFDLHVEFPLLGVSDIVQVIQKFAGSFTIDESLITVKEMSSSQLINEYILPNLNSPENIMDALSMTN